MTRRKERPSWVEFYSRQRGHNCSSDQVDEVGTEQLPFTDDSRKYSVLNSRPSCPNCGWQQEASTGPAPDRCPECWSRLQAVTP